VADVTPVKIPLRRCSPRELEAMFAETEKMLKNGIIQPSTSPWAASVVIVPKPRDPLKGLRYAVDYSGLNKVSKSDCGVLSRIDDLLDSLAGSEVFSMVDAAAGFWGCAVKPEHRYLTAFNTWTHGQMEFVRMPFGLKGAPSTFQRAMQYILHPLTCDRPLHNESVDDAGAEADIENYPKWQHSWWRIASLYLDNVCVHGKVVNHVDDLARVLKRLRGNGVSLKMVKCDFAVTKGKFLGHVVNAKKGISADPDKIGAICGMQQRPSTVSDLRTLIGAMSYLRKFIPDYVDVTRPLREVQRHYYHKGAVLNDCHWSDECEAA